MYLPVVQPTGVRGHVVNGLAVACAGAALLVALVMWLLFVAARRSDVEPESTWADPAERWVCGCWVDGLHTCAAAADGRLDQLAAIETFGVRRRNRESR